MEHRCPKCGSYFLRRKKKGVSECKSCFACSRDVEGTSEAPYYYFSSETGDYFRSEKSSSYQCRRKSWHSYYSLNGVKCAKIDWLRKQIADKQSLINFDRDGANVPRYKREIARIEEQIKAINDTIT